MTFVITSKRLYFALKHMARSFDTQKPRPVPLPYVPHNKTAECSCKARSATPQLHARRDPVGEPTAPISGSDFFCLLEEEIVYFLPALAADLVTCRRKSCQ